MARTVILKRDHKRRGINSDSIKLRDPDATFISVGILDPDFIRCGAVPERDLK